MPIRDPYATMPQVRYQEVLVFLPRRRILVSNSGRRSVVLLNVPVAYSYEIEQAVKT